MNEPRRMEDHPDGAWSPRPHFGSGRSISPNRAPIRGFPASGSARPPTHLSPAQNNRRSLHIASPDTVVSDSNSLIPFDQREDDDLLQPSSKSKRITIAPAKNSFQRVTSIDSRPFDESTVVMEEGMVNRPRKSLAASPKISQSDWEDSPHHGGYQRNYHSDSAGLRIRVPPPRLVEPEMEQSPSLLNLAPNPEPSYNNEDEDSLFDFERGRHKKGYTNRPRGGRARSPSFRDHAFDDDDSSMEEYGKIAPPPTTIQERTQAAWERKRRAASPNTTRKVTNANNSPNVSFGASDTVHHYHDESMETEENATLADRSLNSEYTKSMESEVEDAIKDLFMIGSSEGKQPGRRKLKYHPSVKNRLRAKEDGERKVEERRESSPREVPEQTRTAGKTRQVVEDDAQSETPTREGDETLATEYTADDGELLQGAWNMVEHSLSAVGAALGLSESTAEGDERDPSGIRVGCKPMLNPGDSTSKSKSVKESNDQGKSGFQEVLDLIMGAPPSVSSTTTSRTSTSRTLNTPNEEDAVLLAPSLEQDSRLMHLARQAAKSWHELQGYELDPNFELNIVGDIKFSVVDLALPLGLVFQENEEGCWVTQILSDGHAERSGGIAVGDQLAAVDGISAVRLKVNQVASMVKGRADQDNMELTFLRYVGPLRPAAGDLEEEGYEINAKPKNSPLRGILKGSTPPRQTSSKAPTKKQRTPSRLRKKKPKQEQGPPVTEKKRFGLFGRRK